MRQKEIYNELTEEEKTKIENLDKSVDRAKDKLIYQYKGNTSDVNFNEYIGAIDLINKIKDGDVSFKKAVNNQYELKSKLEEIKKRNNFQFNSIHNLFILNDKNNTRQKI